VTGVVERRMKGEDDSYQWSKTTGRRRKKNKARVRMTVTGGVRQLGGGGRRIRQG